MLDSSKALKLKTNRKILIGYNRMRKITIASLILLLLLNTVIVSAQPYSPPSTKWHTITWTSGETTWIIDVAAYSSMPWTIGGISELHIKFSLKYTSSNRELHLIAKIYKNDQELGSQYIGSISTSNTEIEKTFYIFLPYMNYTNINAGELIPDNIRIEIEGYSGNNTFTDSFDYPITLYLNPSIIRAELYINSQPYYYALEESLSKINVDVKLYNRGPSNASSIIIELYLDNDLIDRQWIEKLDIGNETSIQFIIFSYIKAGLHKLKAIISYKLPDGTKLVTSAQGIIEAYPKTKVVFNADKTIVLEGTLVNFYGKVSPANQSRIVFLEMLTGNTWHVINVTTTNELGLFNFTWKALEIPIYEDFKQYMFRVRVPVSSINENISVTSSEVIITVYSEKRVVDLIADISLNITPTTVFQGQSANISVSIEPSLPVCLPARLLYYDKDVMQWILLDNIDVCEGKGYKLVKLNLPPGKYMVKARISSEYRKIESAPRVIKILETPSLSIEAPKIIVVNTPFNLTLSLKPIVEEKLVGQVSILDSNNTTIFEKQIEFVNGTAIVQVDGIETEGAYTAIAKVNISGQLVNDTTTLTVIKPSIIIEPSEQTVEVGSEVKYTIVVSPPLIRNITVNILKDSTIVESLDIQVDENGTGTLELSAPKDTGKYTILATIRNTNINATAVLNVIEVVRGLKISLLNKTVVPGDKVYIQINVTPLPTQALQVHVLLNISGEWSPIAFGIIDTSGSTTLSFAAPEEEGVYQVKATIPGTDIESNIETLTVKTTSTQLFPQEVIYGIIAAAVIIGLALYFVGRRRRT